MRVVALQILPQPVEDVLVHLLMDVAEAVIGVKCQKGQVIRSTRVQRPVERQKVIVDRCGAVLPTREDQWRPIRQGVRVVWRIPAASAAVLLLGLSGH